MKPAKPLRSQWSSDDLRCRLYRADCLAVVSRLPANSVDAVVTDPPAGIAFMGRSWDGDRGGRCEWIAWLAAIMAECLRVLKPGAHALVWAIPRTSHWTATAVEDAGFEVRDCIYHVFGSGFPKSHDVGKAIDKAAGATRERKERKVFADGTTAHVHRSSGGHFVRPFQDDPEWQGQYDTVPATAAAKQWDGFGTALKPAVECWWLCRKPLEGTVAQNVQKYGTGALNIDACRVGNQTIRTQGGQKFPGCYGNFAGCAQSEHIGRFPANLIHDGSPDVLELFPANPKKAVSPRPFNRASHVANNVVRMGFRGKNKTAGVDRNDAGSAARFFYCAKASRGEREAGLNQDPSPKTQDQIRNHHPTVKPLALMRYLCRLITPPGGLVLDPFLGSGTTGIAALQEGFRFLGIEREPDYFRIARKRIAAALRLRASA